MRRRTTCGGAQRPEEAPPADLLADGGVTHHRSPPASRSMPARGSPVDGVKPENRAQVVRAESGGGREQPREDHQVGRPHCMTPGPRYRASTAPTVGANMTKTKTAPFGVPERCDGRDIDDDEATEVQGQAPLVAARLGPFQCDGRHQSSVLPASSASTVARRRRAPTRTISGGDRAQTPARGRPRVDLGQGRRGPAIPHMPTAAVAEIDLSEARVAYGPVHRRPAPPGL